MDLKKLLVFVGLSAALLYGWTYLFPPTYTPTQSIATLPTVKTAEPNTVASTALSEASSLPSKTRIVVTTDVLKAEIDTMGGDLRTLSLLKHHSAIDTGKPFELLSDKKGHIYIAQTGLTSTDKTLMDLPTHKTVFTAEKEHYTLKGDHITVRLHAPPLAGIQVDKVYSFHRGSYVIDVRYDIDNRLNKPLSLTAYYRFLRGNQTPEGESSLTSTFTGPALYTKKDQFQKIDFEDLDSAKAEYPNQATDGWIAMIQHHFLSAWIFQPSGKHNACAKNCYFDVNALQNNLYSAGVLKPLALIKPGSKKSFNMTLFTGPQEYDLLTHITPGLELSKDYGWVHIFAAPLFWSLTKLQDLACNWGWAIVLLTLIIKALFYPLTAASYRSMAKMRTIAPKLQQLKERFGDDRIKMQQATMELYKTEKINPLGGCLPILIQIPVFIGLYWALLASVELRQSPWIGWIHDLSRPDPFFILPALMAITMVAQTYLSPPPADPVQAKMMKIMPIAFSVMFFFFPAGLVLYWLVNNILSILQQWYVNRQAAR
ncbi:MAG: membrane protein insertase YidC [Neisseriales bacterium]|nr:MAG: membrane protein insertase YidC [Neisseriales bacterium]